MEIVCGALASGLVGYVGLGQDYRVRVIVVPMSLTDELLPVFYSLASILHVSRLWLGSYCILCVSC